MTAMRRLTGGTGILAGLVKISAVLLVLIAVQPLPAAGKSASGTVNLTGKSSVANDSIQLPPVKTEYASRNRQYVFLVESLDGWATKHPTGRLYRDSAWGRQLLWSGKLPQEFGPRHVLVADNGTVLLLDEWINVKSRYAVVLIHPSTGFFRQYSLDQVVALLDLPIARLAKQAKLGWWISGQPTLDAASLVGRVPAGGKTLHIDLRTGDLTSEPGQ